MKCNILVLVCILTNTTLMTFWHFDGKPNMDCTSEEVCPRNLLRMSLSWFVLLQYGEVFFNVIFTFEALAKITLQSIGTKLPNVSFFRALRILRAFRMITRFHRFRLLFRRSAASLQTVLVVTVLLFVSPPAFAIVGMKIFQCEVPTCGQDKETGACFDPFTQWINSLECPMYSEEISGTAACPFYLRRNFNTFHEGLISMFVIFTGERWTDIMIDGCARRVSVS
jgi:hypothetical protein